MNTRGVQNAQMQGPKATGVPEVMEFPYIEMSEGSKAIDGLTRV
jgi:hypothetical protein